HGRDRPTDHSHHEHTHTKRHGDGYAYNLEAFGAVNVAGPDLRLHHGGRRQDGQVGGVNIDRLGRRRVTDGRDKVGGRVVIAAAAVVVHQRTLLALTQNSGA